MNLELGTTIDKYRVEGVIGKGGMAVVYRVRHTLLDSVHALKILTMTSPAVRERLIDEGKVQARLQHPNIVTVTDIVLHRGAPGLVMEFIAGPSLDQLLRNHTLSGAQADLLAQGIIRGVRAAHNEGLVHRDLKPHNIMLQPTDAGLIPKVADFGLAKAVDDPQAPSRTRSGAQLGTPLYMAPEQIKDAKGVDQRADIWALGTVLYELVTHRRAFGGEDTLEIYNRIARADFQPPSTIVPNLPERMDQAIRGCLIPDIDTRIPDCNTLLDVWRGRSSFTAADGERGTGAWDREIMQRARELAPDDGPVSLGASVDSDAATGEFMYDTRQGEAGAATFDADFDSSLDRSAPDVVPFDMDDLKDTFAFKIPGTDSDPVASLPTVAEEPEQSVVPAPVLVPDPAASNIASQPGTASVVDTTEVRPSMSIAAPTTVRKAAVVTGGFAMGGIAIAVIAAVIFGAVVAGGAVVYLSQTPETATSPAPAVVPVAAPSPAPVAAPGPAPVRVKPKPKPRPKAKAKAKPKAKPKPIAAAPGTVDAEGDPIRLVRDGKTYQPGSVPAGTYLVEVYYDGAYQPVRDFTVNSGETLKLRCLGAMGGCTKR